MKKEEVISELKKWLIQNLSFNAPYYAQNLLEETSRKLYSFMVLGASTKESGYEDGIFEIAFENFEIDVRNAVMSSGHGEKHYFSKDLLRNCELIYRKAEDLFLEGISH